MLKSLRRVSAYILIALCCLLVISLGGNAVQAEESGGSYNYSAWGDPVAAPSAYQATVAWNGESLGVGALKDPNDIHVTADKHIYVLDSGNQRIVVLDEQFKPVRTIDSFDRDGQTDHFNNPQGLFVTEGNHVYVADTGNKRIVHLDQDGKLVNIVESPQSESLAAGFQFQPVRIVVDKAQRMYVMSTGVYDGFMEFNADGTFSSFIGANRVQYNALDHLWKMLSTKAQRSQMIMYTPTEFTNMDIDEEGFLYATNGQQSDNVKKLNAQGNDILRRNGYFPPGGDFWWTSLDGAPRLTDIDVTDSDIYSVLDGKRGRILTYNGDGYLMYVFGELGNQLGEFNTAVAFERIGDDFLVLDKTLGEITVFQSTEYGRTLNEAVRSYFKGDEEQANLLYEKTINMNANLDFAYSGIGKAKLRQGDYAEAMKYFKRSLDQKNYSKAFLLYRKQVLREHFTEIVATLFALLLCVFLLKRYRKKRGKKNVIVTGQSGG
ncbi:SMP-30/gluconolactonase/LRE family protein [Cohnella yongneupensis]|uniref:SMP-30/gluconolactonase/LRE family protein n=1 Tax=Cohnella yongneupensis TaxID=425006 RepID=A0ABW0QXG2_9BACL